MWWRLVALVLTLALAPVPAAATAGTTPPLPEPFELDASNGYSIWVLGSPAWKGAPASVDLLVRGHSAEMSYSAPASVSGTSIQASLGVLGAIDVALRPSGRLRKRRSVCGGKPLVFEPGIYEGTIDFTGELGYTELHATEAEGDISALLDAVCPAKLGLSGTGPDAPGGVLRVTGARRRQSFTFVAHKNRPDARAFFVAQAYEKLGPVAISRTVRSRSRSARFVYDRSIRRATVRPPAPFSGRAVFHRNAPRRHRWTGSLHVDFPGRPDVSLTSGDLLVGLIHGEWENSARQAVRR